MKRKYMKSIIIVALIILLTAIFLNDDIRGVFKTTLLSARSIATSKDLNSINRYEMDLKLDDANRILSGTEKVTYYNRSDRTLNDIYFHVYPNAFNKNETVPVMFNDSSYAYPNGFSPCYIEILNVSVDGKKIKYSVSGADSTTLKLELKKPIRSDKYVQIIIDFQLKIPVARDRIGYYDGSYLFGNWYPIAAVYDNTGWNLDPFYDIGDPFYSDSANYQVKITLPDKYIIASTGNIISEKIEEGKKILCIDAQSVRDFAWAASSKFKIYNKNVDGINIKCYFLNSDRERINRAMSTVENTITTFNEEFGKYPYKSYSIVETHFPSGMEYPELAFIPISYFDGSKSMLGLEEVIVHETAHQWWYGVVGNNEIDEAWLDEGLATYSKVIYFEKMNGTLFGRNYYEKNIHSIYENKRKSIKGKEILLKPIYEFDGWKEYDTLAYKKGAVLFDVLRNEVGDRSFFAILKKYYNENKFKNVKTQDFIDAVENTTNKKWNVFFDEWILGK
jgi:aminopeptidase N